MTAIFYNPNKLQVATTLAANGIPDFSDITRPYPDSTEDFEDDE